MMEVFDKLIVAQMCKKAHVIYESRSCTGVSLNFVLNI